MLMRSQRAPALLKTERSERVTRLCHRRLDRVGALVVPVPVRGPWDGGRYLCMLVGRTGGRADRPPSGGLCPWSVWWVAGLAVHACMRRPALVALGRGERLPPAVPAKLARQRYRALELALARVRCLVSLLRASLHHGGAGLLSVRRCWRGHARTRRDSRTPVCPFARPCAPEHCPMFARVACWASQSHRWKSCKSTALPVTISNSVQVKQQHSRWVTSKKKHSHWVK
jgi:hypothetical protein